jgi:VWFA-related protein
MTDWPALALLAAVAQAATAGSQQPRFAERVEVRRLLIDVRVVSDRGEPVLGLQPEDFRVRIGGTPARVESAQWVVGGLDAEPPVGFIEGVVSGSSRAEAPPRGGRLIVLLFQKSLERSRIVGLMRMLIETRGFLDTFTASDRVAVLSFDSTLRIWLDFTADLERVRRVLKHGILFERPPAVQQSPFPSLVARLDPARAGRVYSIERALRLLGEALEPLPGAKSIVLIGHGFGRLGPSGVTMENEYELAREALQLARASLFCLDVTDADYHTLEAGLQVAAEDTGGFYARTHVFTQLAMDRLAGALAGYYVLFVEQPEGDSDAVDVELVGGNGHVLAKRSTPASRR